MIWGMRTTGMMFTAVFPSLARLEISSPMAMPLIEVSTMAARKIQNMPRTSRIQLPMRRKSTHCTTAKSESVSTLASTYHPRRTFRFRSRSRTGLSRRMSSTLFVSPRNMATTRARKR